MNYEHQYLDHMHDLLLAAQKSDRTGTGTQSIFGHQMKHDLRLGFPLLTTKKVFTKGIIHELLWFLNGDTNVDYLKANGVHIWDDWADINGNLGPVYGRMWRSWPNRTIKQVEGAFGSELELVNESIDQIKNLIDGLKKTPTSRRHIVSGWNPAVLPIEGISPIANVGLGRQALPPCHTLFQFNCEQIPTHERVIYWKETVEADSVEYNEGVSSEDINQFMDMRGVPKYYIDVQLYQRSADWLLGVPFNVASYSLLLMMVGQVVNMVPRFFIHTFGDTHLYLNHLEQAELQLSRDPYHLPTMKIKNRGQSIDNFEYSDFELEDYECHPAIKAEISV